jgi:anthranilate/para-aminobenzoate synthase component II
MIYLCDFDDSFTYNIYSDLIQFNLQVKVINYKDVYQFLQTKINSKEKEIIILGPGPGHPRDYMFLDSSIKNLIGRENLLLVGICLGHQLIWQSMGHHCQHSQNPVHGQVQNLILDSFWQRYLAAPKLVQVQRYNSLTVRLNNREESYFIEKKFQLITVNHELMCSTFPGVITYQFHPESVGTSCPKSFYSPLLSFLLE